jgi:hypothetical protein
MFRVVLPPIIRSAYNCICSIWYLSQHRYCYLPLSWKSWNRFQCAVGGVRQGVLRTVFNRYYSLAYRKLLRHRRNPYCKHVQSCLYVSLLITWYFVSGFTESRASVTVHCVQNTYWNLGNIITSSCWEIQPCNNCVRYFYFSGGRSGSSWNGALSLQSLEH